MPLIIAVTHEKDVVSITLLSLAAALSRKKLSGRRGRNLSTGKRRDNDGNEENHDAGHGFFLPFTKDRNGKDNSQY